MKNKSGKSLILSMQAFVKLSPIYKQPPISYMQHFDQVAARYELNNPRQVKERIIWNQLKAIINHLYDHPESRHIVERYERDFRICELEENKGT